MYLEWLSAEHRERAQQLSKAVERSSPAIEFRLDEEVEECRQDGRELTREMWVQRSRIWSRCTFALRMGSPTCLLLCVVCSLCVSVRGFGGHGWFVGWWLVARQ